jgi:hypothetical protein
LQVDHAEDEHSTLVSLIGYSSLAEIEEKALLIQRAAPLNPICLHMASAEVSLKRLPHTVPFLQSSTLSKFAFSVGLPFESTSWNPDSENVWIN